MRLGAKKNNMDYMAELAHRVLLMEGRGEDNTWRTAVFRVELHFTCRKRQKQNIV